MGELPHNPEEKSTFYFALKALIVVGSLVVLYYVISPYQNCVRDYAYLIESGISTSIECAVNTSW